MGFYYTMALISFTDKGFYCRQGDFYIDPWRPVKKAVITHGHSDHARWGHSQYLCHPLTKAVLQVRLGLSDNVENLPYLQEIHINGVKLSLHPAGHVPGSAQVRLEYRGEIAVISGDYKVEYDGLADAFEPLKCHTFISECTFGLPIYRWDSQPAIMRNIENWVDRNQQKGKTSVLVAYSLGKAQRLIKNLGYDRTMYVHSSIDDLNVSLNAAGLELPLAHRITAEISKTDLQKGIVVVPPAISDTKWVKSLIQPVQGVCSGWMAVRAGRRWRSADAGFALSDHADWSGLLAAIKATGAEKVYVTHGNTAVFSRYLNEIGISSQEVKTQFGDEDEEKPDEPGILTST